MNTEVITLIVCGIATALVSYLIITDAIADRRGCKKW